MLVMLALPVNVLRYSPYLGTGHLLRPGQGAVLWVFHTIAW